MAEEEDYGRAVIHVDLDDNAAQAEARTLGQRIRRSIDRATRNLGRTIRRNIQDGLNRPVSVQVVPDVADFAARVRAALAGEELTVPVHPDLADFQARLTAALGGAGGEVSVPVVPDLADFQARLTAALGGAGGEVPVPVVPDVSGFQARLTAALSGLEVDAQVTPNVARFQTRLNAAVRALGAVAQVQVDPDVSRFRTVLEAAVRGMDPVAVQVTVDEARFATRLRRVARGMSVRVRTFPDLDRFESALRTELRTVTARVRVEPDLARFGARLRLETRRLAAVTIQVRADAERFRRELERALRRLPPITIRVDPDLTRLNDALRRHNAPTVRVPVDVDRNRLTGALTSALGKAGSIALKTGKILVQALKFGAIAIAAAGAATAVGQFTAALAPLGGIASALPAVLAGAATALGVFKLSVLGVGEALGAALEGDMEKFTEELGRLAPAARKAIGPLGPQLRELQQTLQQSFFAEFAGEIQGAVKNLKPLGAGLKAVASEFGAATAEALKFFQTEEGADRLNAVITSTADSVGGLVGATQPVIKGFLDLAAAIGEAFGVQVGESIATTGQRLGEYLTGLAESGRGVENVREAVTAFRQLKEVLGNLGGIIRGVFQAGEASGGGFLNNLARITAQFEEFVKSADGQTAISQIFQTLGTIGEQLGPILKTLVEQVGQIAPSLAPIFEEIGPAIVSVFETLGPLIQELAPGLEILAGALADTFAGLDLSGLGTGVSEALEALSPLLPLLGELANLLAEVLGPVLHDLALLFEPIISELVDALLPVLPELGAAFRDIAKALEPLAEALGEGLGDAIEQLLPPLLDELPRIVDELVPAFTDLSDALAPLIPKLLELGVRVIEPLLPLLPDLTAGVREIIEVFTDTVDVARDVYQWFQDLDESMQNFADECEAVGDRIKAFVDDVLGFFRDLYNQLVGNSIIPDLVNGIVEWFLQLPERAGEAASGFVADVVGYFAELPGKIAQTLSELGSSLVETLSGAFTSAKEAVLGFISGLVGDLLALPGQAGTALLGFGASIRDSIASGLESARATVSGFIGDAVGYLAGLPGRAYGALAGLGSSLLQRINEARISALGAVTSFLGQAVGYLRGLPGRAAGALSALGSSLAGQVRAAGSAALARLNSFISDAVRYVRGLPGKARAALGNIKSVLYQAGRDLIAGMVNGVKSAASSLAGAAKNAVGSAIDGAKSILQLGSPSKVFIEIGKDTGKGFVIGLTGTAAEIRQTIERMTRSIRDAFKGKATRLDDDLIALLAAGNKRLQALAEQRDSLAKRIADANKFAAETTKQALALGSVQNLVQGSEQENTDTLLDGLARTVRRVKSFTRQIDALAKRGLRRDLLQQVIQLGPEEGAALAQSLKDADKATVKRLNALQGDLVKASENLGKRSADALFDAGKQAGAGFLAGLRGQRKAIEQLMLDIAKGMQKAIRTALRIKSPSRVFEDIGDLTGAGLEEGFVARLAELRASAEDSAEGIAAAVTAAFATLPASVAASLGNISGKVLAQIKNGLPVGARNLLPFADGGIVQRPTIGLLGEAGREVVIPMTRPRRARQLAEESGLVDLLADNARRRGAGGGGGSVVQNNTINISEVGNARATAHRVVTRLAVAGARL